MTVAVLAPPRHPIVAEALTLARAWCGEHVIDGAPALTHAVRVAAALGRYLPDVAPELVAAVLLHDAPYFAPASVDLDAVLTTRLGASVARVVRALQREHQQHDALAQPAGPRVPTDPWTLYASTADKIVSLAAVLRRAAVAADPAEHWRSRAAFVAQVPYLRAFHTEAAPYLPPAMAAELGRLVANAERATRR